jgi:hypothetical protein
MIKGLCYKNAVIYCLSVATYMDTNGDRIGAGSSEDSGGQRHQLRSIYHKASRSVCA